MKRQITIALSEIDKRKLFFLSTFAVLCSVCLFTDGLPLNDAPIKSKWFGLLFATFAWGMVQPFFIRKKNVTVRSADIAFIVLLVYVALRSLSRGSIEYGLQLTAIIALYAFFRETEQAYNKSLFFVIAILTVVLSLWGIGQWLHLLPSPRGGFLVIGSFDNPAGYASALALGFPFILYFRTTQRKTCRIISYIAVALVLWAVLLSKSRAGLLAVVFTLLWMGTERMKRIGAKGMAMVLMVFLIAGIAGLYFLKKDSADGRLLIWLVTFRLIARRPLFGGGTGAFAAHYMPEQAHYFNIHPDSWFTMLADNICHPFNEYLSVFVQWGVIGFLLIGTLLFFLLKAWRKNSNNESDTLMMALLSLGIFAFFSYPLSYSFSWVVLTLCMAYFGGRTRPIQEIRFSTPPRFLQTAFSVLLLALSVWQYHAYTEWYKVIHHRPSVPMSDLQQRYEKLRPAMERQSQFMYNYAAELYFHGCYSEALDVAYQSQSLRDDYETEHLLADIYKSMKKHSDAQAAYRTMSLMCPNRFIPLYRLFELAVEEDDKHNALQLAKEIVAKPIKVSSPQVVFIKKKCNLYISINQ